MQKFTVMLARFPGGQSEHPDSSDWATQFALLCSQDERIERYIPWRVSTTPITMARNRAIKEAVEKKVDILVMLDSDMGPDKPGVADKDFWPSTFDFMIRRWGISPTIVAAPYLGPSPVNNVYVFRWRQANNTPIDSDFQLAQYTREEAAVMAGIQPAPALPTGLCAIDMRLITGFLNPHTGRTIKMLPPYFQYEYADKEETHLASTEDVVMTRDAELVFGAEGVGPVCFCNWDSWAVHHKLEAVGKPGLLTSDRLNKQFRDAVMANQLSSEREVCLGLPSGPIRVKASVKTGANGGPAKSSPSGDDCSMVKKKRKSKVA